MRAGVRHKKITKVRRLRTGSAYPGSFRLDPKLESQKKAEVDIFLNELTTQADRPQPEKKEKNGLLRSGIWHRPRATATRMQLRKNSLPKLAMLGKLGNKTCVLRTSGMKEAARKQTKTDPNSAHQKKMSVGQWLYTVRNAIRRNQAQTVAGALVIGFVGLLIWFGTMTFAASDSVTLTSQTDWEAGEYYPSTVDTKSTADSMKIQSGYVGDWDKGTPGFFTDTAGYGYWTYDGASYGADLTTDGTYIYQIVGNRKPYLIRFNPELNTWKQLASAPTTFYYGGSMTYDASTKSIFAIDGGEQVETGTAGKHMYQYDIANDTWSRVTDSPDSWGLGSSIAADGSGTIYAVRGRSTDTLWSYDIEDDEWDVTLPALPAPYYVFTTNGQPLEYVNEPYSDGNGDHCQSGCLFALYGNNNRVFFRYDIAERQWYYNSPTDLTIPSALGGVGYGSSFAYDSANDNLYLLHGNQTDDFSKYDVSAETWDTNATDTPDAPGPVYYGGTMVYLDGYIYALKGYAVPDMWRFNVASNAWESISTPAATGNGGENGHMVLVNTDAKCGGDAPCLYVLRGANTNTFWMYTIDTKTWSTGLSTTNLGTLQQGSSMCWDGDNTLYVLRGQNTLSFYSYSISGNAWTVLTSMTSDHAGPSDYPAGAASSQYGGSLACLGSTVYALKGATSAAGSNHFFKYTGGAWSSLTVLPQRAYTGAALIGVPNGADCADATGCVFALTGNQRGDFYRYDTTAGTWTERATMPAPTVYTASRAYDGNGRIYALSSNYDTRMWRYDIASNSWTRTADYPMRNGYNSALAFDPDNNILYAQFGMATSGIARFTPSSTDYISSATWISATQDLDYVSAWEQLTATNPTPGTSSVTFALRSSTDQVTWSDWETVVDAETGDTTTQDLSAITTPAGRYVQIRVTLTSDGTNTPTLSDVTVTYTKDGTAPTNPTITGYADNTEATGIASGETHYYANPYFELTGATDAHSGVAGYYVRWSTDGEDDPAASEDYYQTGTTFEVNTALTAGTTYYLLVKTKDNASNVSASSASFTYVYNGISPATTQTWTAQADFEAAGTTESNINTAAGSGTGATLDAVSPGTWMDLPATYGLASNTTAYNDTSMAWDGNDTIYVLRSVNSQVFVKYTISTKTWTNLTVTGANAQYGSSIVYVPDGITDGCTDDGGCVFATMGGAGTGFRRYDVNATTWTALTAVSGTVGYGAGMVWNGGDYLFLTRGGGQTNFYRYTISTGSWSDRATPDYAINYGGTLDFVPNGAYCSDSSGCIFTMRGGGSDHFWRYDVNANSWSYLTAPPNASSSKGNYGATSVYHDGSVYFFGGYAATDFMKYDILTDTWTLLADLSATHNYGSSKGMVYDTSTDTIFMLRGYNEYSFISYDVVNDKWRNPTMPHGMSSNGFNYSGLTYDGSDTLYATRGGNNNDFYKYVVSTQVWTRLADVPMRMYYTSDIIYVDGYVYALTGAPPYGEAATRFYRYDPTTDLWTRLNDTPNTVGYGTKLVFDGDHTIYTARGAGTTTYYSYNLDSPGWSTQASTIPGTVNNGGCAVMAEVSGTKYIYQVRSTNTLNFYRCTLDTDNGTCTWIADGAAGDPANAPASPGTLYYGAACTVSNEQIFVPRGNTSNLDFLVYDISGDSWTSRSLNSFYYDGRMVTGPNDILYGFRGYNTSSLERYVQQSATTSFERVGTWTSQIIDAEGIYDFAGLTINDTIPDNTDLKYETRTCSDAGCAADADDVNWSDWDEVSNDNPDGSADYYTVDSTPARYVQVKITFTSDRIYTPTLNDLALSYYVDSTAPSNPSAPVDGYADSSKATEISNDTWANDLTPYFEWSTTDNAGGIGLSGFYVYFGSNATKDPVTDASDATNLAYASGTNFYSVAEDGSTGSWNALTQAASALTNGTYYLRLKAKDYNANITSSAVTAFTYKVDTATPSKPTGVSVSPSGYTSTNDFDFSWNASTDSGGSGIEEYCYKVNDEAETCTSQLTVSGALAVQTRGNIFSVRAHDAAGNYSTEYGTVNFYYAGDAPTAPLDLTADPVTTVDTPQQDTNSYSFSWSLPESCLGQTPCDDDDIQRYCYTINELPSASTCGTNFGGSATPSADGGWTTDAQKTTRILPSFSAAKVQGLNTLYVVALDVINNIDYDNYASQAFYYSSNAPGVPTDLQATDSSDRPSQRFSITLTWDVPDDAGSGVTGYNVYRCEQDGASCDNPSAVDDPPASYTEIATVNTLGYLDTGLDNTITYSYLVRATGSGSTMSGNSAVIAMKPEGKFKSPPLMSGQPSVQTRIRSATIQWLTLDDTNQDGELIAHPASSFVEYGETTAYGGETGTSDLVNEHEVALTGLTPDTTYHYKVKWTDVDGNEGESTDYTFDTLGAPSAPINLEVAPSTNTTNSFTFSWDPPSDEGITISGYFFVVNTTPTEDNVQFTTNTTFGPYAAAKRQGVNTFYVVAVDDTGNVNYSSYASIDFTAYTTPPGPPENVTIVDSSNRDAKRYNITLTWDPPTKDAKGKPLGQVMSVEDINYTISRSIDDGKTYDEIATISSTGYLDTALDSKTTYVYKITAEDSAGAASSATDEVSEQPEGRYTTPPAITVDPSAVPDSFAATVTWETERPTSSFVEFGLAKSALKTEQGTAELTEEHSVTVRGLKPVTEYYYQVKSIDIDQNESLSDIGSFTTLEAPKVSEVAISDIRLYDASIAWKTNKPTTTGLVYGPTTDYGFSQNDTSGSLTTMHSMKLQNLADGTLYNVQLAGLDASGNPVDSDNYTFTTLTFPRISNVSATNQREGETEIRWTTNVPTDSTVEYYNDTSPQKTQGNTALVTEHSVLLFGLNDATVYQFVVRGFDQFANKAESDEGEFRTLEDTTPPVISDVEVESNSIGSGDTAKVQIILSYSTNEPTATQAKYGQGSGGAPGTETELNGELVYEHLIVMAELEPARTYVVQAVAIDKAGNRTESDIYTVLSARKRESFLTIIVERLAATFSWLGNLNIGIN